MVPWSSMLVTCLICSSIQTVRLWTLLLASCNHHRPLFEHLVRLRCLQASAAELRVGRAVLPVTATNAVLSSLSSVAATAKGTVNKKVAAFVLDGLLFPFKLQLAGTACLATTFGSSCSIISLCLGRLA